MRLFRKLLLLILIFLFLSLLFISFKYLKWQKHFKVEGTSLICLSDLKEKSINLEEKIKAFTISDSNSEFIVFSQEEVLSILNDNIQNPESTEISNLCISPELGIWTIYLKYRVGKIDIPWIVLDIIKDNRESAEIYINNIMLGNLNVPLFLRKNLLRNINSGISDAIILVNENKFLGREIRNIELLQDKVVIKGNL
jgi:hypothetical protein